MEWLPIESAPQDSSLLLVYTPDSGDGERFDFDYREDGVWVVHAESYDHFMMVGGANAAGPDCVCTGPSEDAPYTHFAVIDPPTDRRTPGVE